MAGIAGYWTPYEIFVNLLSSKRLSEGAKHHERCHATLFRETGDFRFHDKDGNACWLHNECGREK